uniref:Uncharacterized protein n=1 Tax=Arundo donax TaxID=35708 RepID=A0A0A8XTH0_ARUDO
MYYLLLGVVCIIMGGFGRCHAVFCVVLVDCNPVYLLVIR